jgi:hypothetical protein
MKCFCKITSLFFLAIFCGNSYAGEWSSASEFRLIESSGSTIGMDFEYRNIAGKSFGAGFGAEWGTQMIQKSVETQAERLNYFPLMLKLIRTYDCKGAACQVWELGGGASYVAGEPRNWNPFFHFAWGIEFQHSEKQRFFMKIGARGHFEEIDIALGSPDLGSGLFLAVGSRF